MIEEAPNDDDVSAGADAGQLALLLLTILRGSEALRKAGFSTVSVKAVAEQAIALLSR